MENKKPRRTLEFSEHDETFVRKLAGDIGCHYSKANERTYSLHKAALDSASGMGVFAWVHKEEADYFWVATRKVWVEQARAKALTARKKSRPNYFPRDNQHADDSVSFNMKDDYENTVKVLSLVNQSR